MTSDTQPRKRDTQPRRTIRRILKEATRPLSPHEVLSASETDKPIGLATIYRNLKALHEEGWLEMVELPGQPARYELADKGHHHHFYCHACARVFDIPGCHGGSENAALKEYQVTHHEITYFGHCPDCLMP